MNDAAAISTLNDLFRRLRMSLPWVAAQFWATLLLVLAGVAWTRLPDQYAWQVGLTLLLPLVLLALALLLEAGTMRKLLNMEQGRAPLAMGALTLVAWTAIVWLAWWLLDWCDDQIPVWTGYLNSRASAHLRATLFSYEHIQSWLTILVWIFRWIVVPGKVIPYAMASAQWGWRLPLQLALVAGGCRGGAPGRGVAQPFLHCRAAGNGSASGVVHRAQVGRSLSAGRCKLGPAAGVGCDAARP
jgi:hypothetical protein